MGLRIVLAALAIVSPWAFAAGDAATFLDLDLRQERYLGDVQHSTQGANYTLFGYQVNLESEQPKRFTGKFNSRGMGAFEIKEETYFGIPEAYLEYSNGPVRLTAGRKKHVWSRIDEDFHLGLWQPELRWDYLAPVQQGLTGVFADFMFGSDWHLILFTSGLNIPDQGPQYRLENGQFYSSNRWFRQPTGSVRLFNETAYASDAPLYYQINKPPDGELFLQTSFGLGIEYGNDSGYWAHLNYAYKPRNQIHLGVECTNCANLGLMAPLEITAVIHPKIVKHHVITAETGFDHVDDRGWLSLTGEFPDRSGFPNSYEEASLNDAIIAGAAYQHYVGSWLGGRPAWIQYSYFRVFDVSHPDSSGLVKEDQVRSSMDRYPLRNVLALDYKIRIRQAASSRIHWTNRYQYSIPEQGGWLSTKIELTIGPLNWMVGADILGSNIDPDRADAGLFTRYRSNDRVFGGISYVF